MALTADWNALGELYYRKKELYTLDLGAHIDFSKCHVTGAQYAGPVALMRDDSKLQKVQSGTKPVVYILTSSGKEIASFRWTSGKVIKLGWSNKEDLLCVQDDGTVLVYDLFGTFKRTFSMGQDAKDVKVIDSKVFNNYGGTGIAILTTTYRLYVVNNVDDPRIRRLAEVPGLDVPPSSWTIVNQDRQSRALVAKEGDLFVLDHGGQFQQQNPPISCTVEAYIEMALNYNHKYLALFTSTGLLWIGSSDLQKVYCEFDTKSPTRPQQLVWCDSGAIVAYWKNILLMVGPKKDWVKYIYDSPLHLVPEEDGLRIISHDKHEFLQRVPGPVEEVFKIGSMSPGAMLFEASKEFQKGSQRADEYIRMIKDKLDSAVEQCIDAAGHEWDPHTQKTLLRAASFGKCFLTDVPPEKFVNMCKMLRVLNAIHEDSLGIPLTYFQLERLTIRLLIDRLVMRRHYCLAIRICQYLKISESEGVSRILAHWACNKVQQTRTDDETLARTIAQKLGDTPGVSYSEIANRAIECGRTELAIRLLDFEPKAAEQVPLLMKMKRDQLALSKAIDSGDTDLVYTVLLHLKEILPLGEFLMAIRTMPVAYSLFLQYCRDQNRNMLHDLFYQEDNYQEEANCRVIDSYDDDRIKGRLTSLLSARDAYSKAKNEWAAKQTEDQVKLLKYQRRLEEELNRPHLDQSLHQTIYRLTVENNHKLAEELRREFKVPDRRFWWLKIQALAEAGDWMELDKFSKSKKSPIGYEPFVEVCMKQHNKHEAQKYLTRVAPENKVKCYVRAGQLEQAADIAFQQKSDDDLNMILSKCGSSNRQLVEQIQAMKSQLTNKR